MWVRMRWVWVDNRAAWQPPQFGSATAALCREQPRTATSSLGACPPPARPPPPEHPLTKVVKHALSVKGEGRGHAQVLLQVLAQHAHQQELVRLLGHLLRGRRCERGCQVEVVRGSCAGG